MIFYKQYSVFLYSHYPSLHCEMRHRGYFSAAIARMFSNSWPRSPGKFCNLSTEKTKTQDITRKLIVKKTDTYTGDEMICACHPGHPGTGSFVVLNSAVFYFSTLISFILWILYFLFQSPRPASNLPPHLSFSFSLSLPPVLTAPWTEGWGNKM